MRIWIIDPHDAIPGEAWGHKHGTFLAMTLVNQGHEVVYWNSNFSHATKNIRSNGWSEIQISDRYKIILVPISSYKAHVSITRLLSFVRFAISLWLKGRNKPRPDCIFLTIPTPFSDVVAVLLARRHKAALILDFRDLWPELFETIFPASLRGFARVLLGPLYWARRFALRNASGLTSVCKTYLDLAFREVPELRERPHVVIYHTGVVNCEFRARMQNDALDGQMVPKLEGETWVIYAGTIGNNYDMRTLWAAAGILRRRSGGENIRIIVAGDGPLSGELTNYIRENNLENLNYVGPLGADLLSRYYAKADLGLCIYQADSTVGIPAKAYDLYAANLPIINSLEGEFGDYLATEGIGRNYHSGDPESLAQTILALASDPGTLATMRAKLVQLAPEYDRDVQYAKNLSLIASVKPLGD